jgi:hypothetical protein
VKGLRTSKFCNITHLTREEIRATAAFAADHLASEESCLHREASCEIRRGRTLRYRARAGLRDDGLDVWYAIESARGADDETILRQATADDRMLLTEDKESCAERVVVFREVGNG